MNENQMILKILPSLRARLLPDGQVVLTRKFIDGVVELQKAWAGPVAVYVLPADNQPAQMDDVSVWPKALSFQIEVLTFPEIVTAITADRSAVVLLSLDDFRQSGLGAICRQHRIACAYISEYSLATRKQIIDATTRNPLKRVRRKFWETNEERKRRVAVAGATGLQCNGTPTFDCYQELCEETILFFDTRVTEDLLATEEDISRRFSGLNTTRPLRLLFSGRLVPMKGSSHLLEVAKELRRLQVDFHLSICGEGEAKQAMSRSIQSGQLGRYVSLNGVLEFKTELVPFVKSDIDLFICCHPQGDPSCTYLETMSCGVPIVGYANEAFAGVVRSSECGWLTPLNRPEELARMVRDIQRTPKLLREQSAKALAFAKTHTFDRTVSRRISHLKTLDVRIARASKGERIPDVLPEALKERVARGGM